MTLTSHTVQKLKVISCRDILVDDLEKLFDTDNGRLWKEDHRVYESLFTSIIVGGGMVVIIFCTIV